MLRGTAVEQGGGAASRCPAAAWVSPTASWASPRQSSRSASGADFHASSSTSWAWNGRPASSSACASASACVRRTDDALRGALLADGAVGQRPAERVPGAGVAGAARGVPVPCAGHRRQSACTGVHPRRGVDREGGVTGRSDPERNPREFDALVPPRCRCPRCRRRDAPPRHPGLGGRHRHRLDPARRPGHPGRRLRQRRAADPRLPAGHPHRSAASCPPAPTTSPSTRPAPTRTASETRCSGRRRRRSRPAPTPPWSRT